MFFEDKIKIVRWLLKKTVLSADLCLFETKGVVRYFKEIGFKNIVWFSNYTRYTGALNAEKVKNVCRRFVYLGHIRRSKGIDVILDAAPLISEDVTIDLYGPLYDGFSADKISELGRGRVNYRGILSKEKVFEILWDYDALVHPAFHPTEGYPGAILEAFSHGLPVISTRWRAIPEIVDDSCGILVEPLDVNELGGSINLLHTNIDLYLKLRKGSFERAKRFSDIRWTDVFLQLLQEVIDKNKQRTVSGSERRTIAKIP